MSQLFIHEVVSRDGFQNEGTYIPTETKIDLIDHLSALGYGKIEVTSFTSPRAIPALRDAEAVMAGIRRNPDITYTVLVPNVRGAERALACAPDEVNLVMSVSETHNRTNLRMSREQSFQQLGDVIRMLQGSRVRVNVSLSTVFGCPMEGDVAAAEVLRFVDRFAALGVTGITLCDTTGMAFPSQVAALAREVRRQFESIEIALHFHNTRGMALANVVASLDEGIVHYESSLGGLGGCPYAPGASGNVCTEELVHMLNLMGYDTGVDAQALLEVAGRLPAIVGHDVPSQIIKAGLRSKLHPVPSAD